AQRRDPHADVYARFGILSGETRGNRVHFDARLLDPYTRFQTTHDPMIAGRTDVVRRLVCKQTDRNPHVSPPEFETRRHDADDRIHLIVEPQRAAYDAALAAKAPLPECITQCHRPD